MANTETNRWSPDRYDQHAGCVSAYGADLLELLGPLHGAEVLDLGCGTGDLAAQLAERGAHVLGVDASQEMVDAARTKCPSLQFERKDGQALDFDACFSHVFSNAALHWMPDADAVARGVARALRPGGLFVAEFGGFGCVATARGALTHVLNENDVSAGQWLPNWFFPSVGEYTPTLERHGLRVQSAWLFERPTRFAGPEGLRNWIRVFATRAVEHFGARADTLLARVEELCRPTLWQDDSWVLDYVRIRVVARRVATPS